MIREYHLPIHLSQMASVSFKVVKKVRMFVSGDSNSPHKPSGHGYSGEGSIKLSMLDQFFLLVLYYDKEPSRHLYSHVPELYKFVGKKVGTSNKSK